MLNNEQRKYQTEIDSVSFSSDFKADMIAKMKRKAALERNFNPALHETKTERVIDIMKKADIVEIDNGKKDSKWQKAVAAAIAVLMIGGAVVAGVFVLGKSSAEIATSDPVVTAVEVSPEVLLKKLFKNLKWSTHIRESRELML